MERNGNMLASVFYTPDTCAFCDRGSRALEPFEIWNGNEKVTSWLDIYCAVQISHRGPLVGVHIQPAVQYLVLNQETNGKV